MEIVLEKVVLDTQFGNNLMENNQNLVQAAVYECEATADETQKNARQELENLFASNPLPQQDLLLNLGLFTRSSLLAKYITLHEIYGRFVRIPGLIAEFGTWWGQNLVLLENLRAIHEPFNKQRRIIGFDTFNGYTEPSLGIDKASIVWAKHSYTTGKSYQAFLNNLLVSHEKSNVMGNINGLHTLIEGDIVQTAPKYFVEHPESLVAFAYFDLGLYEPTKAAMTAIKPHLLPGSIILLDELTWAESPGEAIAFKEVFHDTKYSIEKCNYFPSKSIVIFHGK